MQDVCYSSSMVMTQTEIQVIQMQEVLASSMEMMQTTEVIQNI